MGHPTGFFVTDEFFPAADGQDPMLHDVSDEDSRISSVAAKDLSNSEAGHRCL